jgi:hypothetical protein
MTTDVRGLPAIGRCMVASSVMKSSCARCSRLQVGLYARRCLTSKAFPGERVLERAETMPGTFAVLTIAVDRYDRERLGTPEWRKRVGVEPTQDRLRPLPGLKSGRPTGSDSLPWLTNQHFS